MSSCERGPDPAIRAIYERGRAKRFKIPIHIPAIVKEKVFLEAQERLDINQYLASRNTKEMSILQGLVGSTR